MRRHSVLWIAGILLCSVVFATATASAQAKPAAKSETGYIVNLGESALVISNRPPGQPRTISRSITSEGGGGGASGGSVHNFNVQLGPGDVVRGPDGKLTLSDEAKKRFTPEQAKTIQETLNSQAAQGGGPVIVRRGPDGAEGGQGNAQVQPGKASAPSGPLQLTDFVLDKKTKSARDLAKGDKVKVTYVEAGGKKVATKIEKEK